MADRIKCPKCGSERVAMVLYGMPAFDKELEAKIDAGDVVLNGCCIDGPTFPYECRGCGVRFDEGMAKRLSAKVYFSDEDYAWIEEVANTLMNHSLPVNDEKYEKWTGELKTELAALEG